MELNERLTDVELNRLIWGLEAHGNLKRTLAGLVELRELRNKAQLRDHLQEDQYQVAPLAGSTEKILGQCTPDSQIQSRNLLNPFRSPMHLQDPETGETHVLQRIRPAHHT